MSVSAHYEAVMAAFLERLGEFPETGEFSAPPPPATVYEPTADAAYCRLYGEALAEAAGGPLASRVVPMIDRVHEWYGAFWFAAQLCGSEDERLWVATDQLYHSLRVLKPFAGVPAAAEWSEWYTAPVAARLLAMDPKTFKGKFEDGTFAGEKRVPDGKKTPQYRLRLDRLPAAIREKLTGNR